MPDLRHRGGIQTPTSEVYAAVATLAFRLGGPEPDSDKSQDAEDHRAGWAGFTDRLAGSFADRPGDRPDG